MIRAFKGNYPVNNPFGTYDPVAYANYPGNLHPGTDYPLPFRTPLYAGMSGTLSRKLWGRTLRKGNEAVMTNGNVQRRYAHMDEITRPDGPVKEGEFIGWSGYTGYVMDAQGNLGTKAGSHLHDELLIDGVYVSLEDHLKEGAIMASKVFINQAIALATGVQATNVDYEKYADRDAEYVLNDILLSKTHQEYKANLEAINRKALLYNQLDTSTVASKQDIEDAARLRAIKEALK